MDCAKKGRYYHFPKVLRNLGGGVGLKGGGRAKLGAFFPHIGIMDENYIPDESTDKSSLSWEIRKKLEEGARFRKTEVCF